MGRHAKLTLIGETTQLFSTNHYPYRGEEISAAAVRESTPAAAACIGINQSELSDTTIIYQS